MHRFTPIALAISTIANAGCENFVDTDGYTFERRACVASSGDIPHEIVLGENITSTCITTAERVFQAVSDSGEASCSTEQVGASIEVECVGEQGEFSSTCEVIANDPGQSNQIIALGDAKCALFAKE